MNTKTTNTTKTNSKTVPTIALHLCLVGIVGCGPDEGAGLTTSSSSAATQALLSVGPRDSSGGCPAEYASCPAWRGDGTDIPGGGGGWGAGGGGGGGEVQCGPNGQFWVPGTGCHPDSLCFQDIDNYKNAGRIKDAAAECKARGGKGGVFPNPNTGEPAGYACDYGDGTDAATNFPTTNACLTEIGVDNQSGDPIVGEKKDILVGEPTRPAEEPKEPPPLTEEEQKAAEEEAAAAAADAQQDRIDTKLGNEP